MIDVGMRKHEIGDDPRIEREDPVLLRALPATPLKEPTVE
jgi:hypothetical protein